MATVLRFPTMVSPVVPPGHCAQDWLLAFMKREGIPLTRENYIELATLGGNPAYFWQADTAAGSSAAAGKGAWFLKFAVRNDRGHQSRQTRLKAR